MSAPRQPDEALYAPDDGLGLYRRLLRSAEEALRAGGAVIFQLHRRIHIAERVELATCESRLDDLVPNPMTVARVDWTPSWASSPP